MHMASNEDFYGWDGSFEVVGAEGIAAMGGEEALSGGTGGDGETEDDGFRCFSVAYGRGWADSCKWDTGSSAEELKAGWKTV